jgi:hypothetical protein
VLCCRLRSTWVARRPISCFTTRTWSKITETFLLPPMTIKSQTKSKISSSLHQTHINYVCLCFIECTKLTFPLFFFFFFVSISGTQATTSSTMTSPPRRLALILVTQTIHLSESFKTSNSFPKVISSWVRLSPPPPPPFTDNQQLYGLAYHLTLVVYYDTLRHLLKPS